MPPDLADNNTLEIQSPKAVKIWKDSSCNLSLPFDSFYNISNKAWALFRQNKRKL